MKSLVPFLAVVLQTVTATTPICKSLSTILKELPKGENNWLNHRGDTCFSLTLDLESIPPGRTEADLRSYYGTSLAYANVTQQIQADASKALQFDSLMKQAYDTYQLEASTRLSLQAIQATFKLLLNFHPVQKFQRTKYGKPDITSLSSVELLYTDLNHYRLSFHPKSATPKFYYQNGVPSTKHPNAANFSSMAKPYSTDLTSGTWSLEYHGSISPTNATVSQTPLSTVQLGIAINGSALTNTLEPNALKISHPSLRRMHYVVNGDGIASGPTGPLAGAKTMPFAIVGDPLEPPACAHLKSAYTSSSCCGKSVGCGILKSTHRQMGCCTGASSS